MKLLFQKIPYSTLIIGGILLGLAPFFPEPHSIEKIRMLMNGELKRPIDIFDLFYHLLPEVLILIKYIIEKKGGIENGRLDVESGK